MCTACACVLALTLAAAHAGHAVAEHAGSAPATTARRLQDTAAPQLSCAAQPVAVPSSTMELTTELALPRLFEQLGDDDAAADAAITVTVSSGATGAELDSETIAPNAGAASSTRSLDACDSSNSIHGTRLTDGVGGAQIGRGDSPVLPSGADYQNSVECFWRLSCSNTAARPALTFTSFNTEQRYDYVNVRDGAGPTDQLLSAQSGWGDYTHEYAWAEHRGAYLLGATSDNLMNHASQAAAQQACIDLGDGCGGIVQSCGTQCDDLTFGQWHTRAGRVPYPNPDATATVAHEIAWVKTSSDVIQAGAAAVVATGPDMFVHFVTDGSVTKSGFTATFTCVGAEPVADSRSARSRYNDNDDALTFESYERYDGLDCTSKTLGSTNALADAVQACNADSACFGVQDRDCDGTGFAACLSDTTYVPVNQNQRIRSCVYERPAYQRTTIGPLELAALQEHPVDIQVSDRAGNAATCSVVIRVVAPQLVLQSQDGVTLSAQDGITADAPITTNDRVDITLSNDGTDDLVLRTGAPRTGTPYGMTLTDGSGGTVSWAVARIAGENGDSDVQVAGTSDFQIVLPSGTQRTLYIEFYGPQVPSEGTYTGQLEIASNDPVTPQRVVPLQFTVNDYDLIMIGLPETMDAQAAPGTMTELSQTIYNVYCGELSWSKADCTCDGSDPDYPCRLQHSGDVDEVLVELDVCSGTISTGESGQVLMRLTAPHTAGSYSKSWRVEPTNSLSSQSFLRASINMMVIPALDDFQPTRTSILRLVGSDDAGPVRASHDFRLLCTMKDSYDNEIRNDGLEGWSLVLIRPCGEGEDAPCSLDVPIIFDFSLADGGRPGLYTTAAITAGRKGEHSVATISDLQGQHSLVQSFPLAVEPLQCEPPRVVPSEDGAQCFVQWCDAGSQPSDDQLLCMPCGRGQSSSIGRACETCGNGTFATKTGSVSCDTCEAGKTSNSDNTGCEKCDPGEAPNVWRNNCTECGSGTFSSSGESCAECPAPFRIIIDDETGGRIGCEKCDPGQEPNPDRTDCLPCAGTTYSSFGVECTACEDPSIVNSQRTTCTSCPPGRGPNVARTGCDACTGDFYSKFGVCQQCLGDYVVSADKIDCLAPTACAAGTECPVDICNQPSDCTPCSTGYVSAAGGQCYACSEPGKVARVEQDYCNSCLAGSEPLADRSDCQPCVGATFSPYGSDCLSCERPNVVNAERTVCSPCAAGKGPNEDRTECLPCEGATFSTMGQCQNCTAPNVVDSDKITCGPCPAGQGPNENRDGCVDCELNEFSNLVETDGRCQRCPEGQYPNEFQSACNFCPPGETTSVDGSGCDKCSAGTVRPEGGVTCTACESGTRANTAQSACVPCETGSIPSEDRMSCICEVCLPDRARPHCCCLVGWVHVSLNVSMYVQVGYYDTKQLPKVDCYDTDFQFTSEPATNNAGCTKCPECMICDSNIPRIQEGYGVASWPITVTNDDLRAVGLDPGGDSAPDKVGSNQHLLPPWAEDASGGDAVTAGAVQNRTFVFKCPVPDACIGNMLVEGNGYNDSCAQGHEGRLCFNCEEGWRKGPKGTCSVCEKEGTDHLFLVPVGFVFAYFAFRMLLSRRRQKRLDRVAMSEELFEELDLDGSGEINRTELLNALQILGHTDADETTAIRIMDLIDLDRSGGIDKHEFVAWMVRSARV